MSNLCCGRSGGPKLVFHWSAAWPSWQPLWWGMISFQNFRSLKLGHGFPCFKRIIYIWRIIMKFAKMFLGYQCEKGCEAFLIFQILLLLSALMWRRSVNIQFANFKIDFLVNQSENRKRLTRFCCLSATDWDCAVCLVVLVSKKAGNSNSVSFAFEGLCPLTIESNLKKKLFLLILHFISFILI